ncbi:MAG: adenosylmethionine--8-amino-7-oxononanoate transaminase [Candidatus Omnitrophica bacterium]|nr:adenosylmethionine--8-amino-7-oxononanoate transaminase [Candidatus Omnitrophota bacterium]
MPSLKVKEKPRKSPAQSLPKTDSLAAKDKRYLWHPFTQMRDWQEEDILIIEKGDGVYLEDIHGKKYLDGVSSLWCNVHGHRVPEIDKAVSDQLKKIAHSTFLGLSNVPAIELAEKLIRIAPRGLTRVFYSDSGSSAVEVALKMAFQYWRQRGFPKKSKFVKLTQSYHGDTLGSVSVGGIELFHQIYGPLLFETYSAPAPYRYRWPSGDNPQKVMEESLAEMEKVLSLHKDEVAALIMEPLMQGAAGMIDQPAGYISRARELTKRYNTLLIFDEVATGFGRTGKMFASDHEKVTPDLMTVAKGITGGYLPLAATLATEEIYEAFLGPYSEFKAFFHGHTYTANPLAARAACASLELFEKNRILEKLPAKVEFLKQNLRNFYHLPIVGDIRQAGLMVGIELVKNKKTKEAYGWEEKIGIRVIQKAREKGAILRPLGPVIVLMPPLAMEKKELKELLDITYESIQETV